MHLWKKWCSRALHSKIVKVFQTSTRFLSPWSKGSQVVIDLYLQRKWHRLSGSYGEWRGKKEPTEKLQAWEIKTSSPEKVKLKRASLHLVSRQGSNNNKRHVQMSEAFVRKLIASMRVGADTVVLIISSCSRIKLIFWVRNKWVNSAVSKGFQCSHLYMVEAISLDDLSDPINAI